MEIPRKNHKEMTEIKNAVTEMKKAFDGLMSRQDIAEERKFELEDTAVGTVRETPI